MIALDHLEPKPYIVQLKEVKPYDCKPISVDSVGLVFMSVFVL